jgi:hypothetical protein
MQRKGPGRLRLVFGARSSTVVAIVALLALAAGGLVAGQITGQMRREADDRLAAHVATVATAVEATMERASSDIRLASRDETYELALSHSTGQLLTSDRLAVERAITYLGERYDVDEICLIRADGMEAARWVNGGGVAPVEDLSPDERGNNPAVIPTVPLPDDAFYQTQPYVSADSNRWVIGVATPIILSTGSHAGILHFEIPIARFVDQLAHLGYGSTGYAILLDRQGRLLVHPDIAGFRAASNLSTDPATGPFPEATATGTASWRDAVAQMMGGRSGSASFDQGGRLFRVTYAPVPDSDRIVAVVSPASELYADADRMVLNLGLTAGPLIMLMVAVSAWFASA